MKWPVFIGSAPKNPVILSERNDPKDLRLLFGPLKDRDGKPKINPRHKPTRQRISRQDYPVLRIISANRDRCGLGPKID